MYKETGYIDADDNVAFNTHADACNCFGHSYQLFLRALARHPVETELTIWFPRLYDNVVWDNSISEDEETIYERRIDDNAGYIQDALTRPDDFKRLVFVGMRDTNGRAMYCFKGLYEVDVEASRNNSAMTYRRKKKRAPTYAPKGKSNGQS